MSNNLTLSMLVSENRTPKVIVSFVMQYTLNAVITCCVKGQVVMIAVATNIQRTLSNRRDVASNFRLHIVLYS